jgi:hypothetical protein
VKGDSLLFHNGKEMGKRALRGEMCIIMKIKVFS